MIYLDNAATTLVKPRSVISNVQWAMNHLGSPGRGGHSYAMAAADMAFRCREEAAKMFGVSEPDRVVFTFNATHGLNIAISSLVSAGDRVIISGYEHNSVLRPLIASGARVDVAKSELFCPEAAVEAFRGKLREPAAAVVVNHVSNVFGFALPVREIAAMCRDREVPLIIDASQSAGAIELNMEELGAAFIAMPGHKGLYGPQGTGLLLCGIYGKPLLHGGSGSNSASDSMPEFLPDRLEAGTHNMPGIAGLYAGIRFVAEKGISTILSHERKIIAGAADALRSIERVTVYTPREQAEECQTGVLSFTIDGISSETVGQMLGNRGIAVRAGLHCSPLAHKTVGTFPDGTVRISASLFNAQNDGYALAAEVRKIARDR